MPETTMVSLRLPAELVTWATAYAEGRGVSRTDLLASALVAFKEDAESGVPDIRQMARRQSSVTKRGEPVGSCPKNEAGHVLVNGACEHCGLVGRSSDPSEPSVLNETTASRVELFSRLRAPQSARGQTAAEKRAS